MGILLPLLCRCYYRTLRVGLQLPDQNPMPLAAFQPDPVVYAHFERDIAVAAAALACAPVTVMVAEGREGDWGSRILERVGCHVIRGSSLHSGARALRSLLTSVRHWDGPVALCVDGPVGPALRAKAGALFCARHLGRPVIPVGTAARGKVVLPGSWSGIFLPLPFARCSIACGEPLNVPDHAGRPEIERLTVELERRMRAAGQRARELLRR